MVAQLFFDASPIGANPIGPGAWFRPRAVKESISPALFYFCAGQRLTAQVLGCSSAQLLRRLSYGAQHQSALLQQSVLDCPSVWPLRRSSLPALGSSTLGSLQCSVIPALSPSAAYPLAWSFWRCTAYRARRCTACCARRCPVIGRSGAQLPRRPAIGRLVLNHHRA